MNEIEKVIKAQAGDQAAFGTLVSCYQSRIYGYAVGRLRNNEEAEEVCQETFLKCFLNLRYLERAEAFSAWLFSICRNQVISRVRRRRNRPAGDPLTDEQPEIERAFSEWRNYGEALRISINMLTAEQREMIRLKYFAGLSMKEIRSVTGQSLATIKSRLYEGRGKIRRTLPRLHGGLEMDPDRKKTQKESIMRSLELIKLGAHVFARLSLIDQKRVCEFADAKLKFDDDLLQSIGKIPKGSEFVQKFQGNLLFTELIDILNYGDSFVERRIIEYLDEADPELAEKIKQNMFVFDDLVLFDVPAMKKLIARVNPEDMQIAMVVAHKEAKDKIYAVLGEEEAEKWKSNLTKLDIREKIIQQKQFEIIEEVRKMEQEREIIVGRDEGFRPYPIIIKG